MDAAILRLAVVARNVDQSDDPMLVVFGYLHSAVLERVGLVHGDAVAGVPLPGAADHWKAIVFGLHELHP